MKASPSYSVQKPSLASVAFSYSSSDAKPISSSLFSSQNTQPSDSFKAVASIGEDFQSRRTAETLQAALQDSQFLFDLLASVLLLLVQLGELITQTLASVLQIAHHSLELAGREVHPLKQKIRARIRNESLTGEGTSTCSAWIVRPAAALP